jgi:hypothetical protein
VFQLNPIHVVVKSMLISYLKENLRKNAAKKESPKKHFQKNPKSLSKTFFGSTFFAVHFLWNIPVSDQEQFPCANVILACLKNLTTLVQG